MMGPPIWGPGVDGAQNNVFVIQGWWTYTWPKIIPYVNTYQE